MMFPHLSMPFSDDLRLRDDIITLRNPHAREHARVEAGWHQFFCRFEDCCSGQGKTGMNLNSDSK
jgi:hypothetical protein